MVTQRTRTHQYPTKELDAMIRFYGGEMCSITKDMTGTEWAHLMDTALSGSNEMLDWMLRRNLREDRHPRHAAEVRENVVPSDNLHGGRFDSNPCTMTLFLHEDILVRTLAYELDVVEWRLKEVEEGRGDPGRPQYSHGYPVLTEHRLHLNPLTLRRVAITRYIDDEPVQYFSRSCPGIDTCAPREQFLVIQTLLSIPFSVLHTVPRLAAFTGRSSYQRKVLEMGQHIMDLWDWDPPSSSNPISTSVAQRAPLPSPIFDPSRATLDHNSFTYSLPTILSLPLTSAGTSTSTQHILNLADGCVLVNTSPSSIYDKHTMLELAAPHDLDDNLKDSGSMIPDNVTSFSCNFSSVATEEDSDSEPRAPYSALSVDDIQGWAALVAEAGEEAKMGVDMLKYDPMVKGTIASHTVNEILMIKGAITPPTYLQYDDLLVLPSLDPTALRI
ncbi:hypothetical protein EV368DRAFT_45306 [Lentinula lateritia]|nr:hypothetical protein EV368DRAFT_45306 [Lentinula lateritia]